MERLVICLEIESPLAKQAQLHIDLRLHCPLSNRYFGTQACLFGNMVSTIAQPKQQFAETIRGYLVFNATTASPSFRIWALKR